MLAEPHGLLNQPGGLELSCHLAQPMIRCLDGDNRFKRSERQFFLAEKVKVTLSWNEIGQIGRTNVHLTRREHHPLVELRKPIAATSHLKEELPFMLPRMRSRAVKVHHLVGD